MRRTPLLALTTLFSGLGIADAWYLAEHALTDTALSCGVGSLSGCNVVAQSAYSHFLGVPLGVYGVVFYAVVFAASLFARSSQSRLLEQFLLLCGVVGVLSSLYFAWIQLFIIKAICIYCIGSFVLSIGILVTTFLVLRHTKPLLPATM
jgi:uncharacterized membrane protein